MSDIVRDDDGSRLCATRRSAGLPFYVQALVSTEPSSAQRHCFTYAMTQLMQLALTAPLATAGDACSDQQCAPQVHALNVLRALVRDARLSADVTPYVSDAVRAAIGAYSSRYWSVRNSGTLLFSALLTRIFGVKRGKDEASRRNCVTAWMFVTRYPGLHDFLLKEISTLQPDAR